MTATVRTPDFLIVGAGPTGCVIAERAAHERGWTSVIIDKRNHIAGNCYDSTHRSGVMIHNYGPHCFRTNSEVLVKYLSQFTDWIPGNYICKSSVNGKLYPFPINRKTLEMFFETSFNDEGQVRAFLERQRIPIAQPKTSEDHVISQVGRQLYEAFYKNYTFKQWGVSASELDASICARIPVRTDYYESYVNHTYQITPSQGFTKLFQNMVSSPRIQTLLNTDYKDVKNKIIPNIATVYSGPIDEYFDFSLGRLPWRSLDFKFKEFNVEFKQPCYSINYPNDHDYTRSVEIKHVTQQKIDRTVISYEYSKSTGDPYYPVLSAESLSLYKKYEDLARQTAQGVYFKGRLGKYKYFNMDEVIIEAQSSFRQIENDYISSHQRNNKHNALT